MCGSRDSTLLYASVRDHKGIATEPHAFRACLDCGSATVHPRPVASELAGFYPEHYSFRREGSGPGLRRALADLEWRVFYLPLYRARLQIITRLTGLRSGRVLEVGCGNGHLLSLLASAGFDAEGIDTSVADIAYARDVLGLDVHCGGLDVLEAVAGQYDAIVMFSVLEHLPEPLALLNETRRLLKPGGWVVLGIPVLDSLQSRLLGARWCAVTEAPRHLMLPSLDGMRRLLTSAGFRDVRAVPAPVMETAGHIALSLLPGAGSPGVYGRGGALGAIVRRSIAGLSMLPALLVAALERTSIGGGVAGVMVFRGRV